MKPKSMTFFSLLPYWNGSRCATCRRRREPAHHRTGACAAQDTARSANWFWVLWLAVGVMVSLSAAPSRAAEPPTVAEVLVGLGGKFKVGHWTPVRITLRGGQADFAGSLEAVLPDSDDLATRFTQAAERSVQVPAGGVWTGWRYVKLGKIRGRMEIVLRSADGHEVRRQTVDNLAPQPATWQWAVNSGPEMGLDQASVFMSRARGEKFISSQLQEPAEFPDQWCGYEGVDVLLVVTGEESPLERLTDAQFEAVLQWLRMGGKLLCSAGRRAPELFREGSRFHALRPGDWEELDPYWKASGLEHFARAVERLPTDEEAPLAVFRDWRGKVLCYEGGGGATDRVLITQYPFGFGEVTFVALDLERPPLAQWPARPRLLARLLPTRSEDEDAAIGSEGLGKVTHVGYDDLAGQLRAALDQYAQVTLVRFSWIAGLLVLYVLLLGPVDFFGLHKIRRLHWTWVTFPLLVLAFCLLAVWLSQQWKGSQLAVNQVDVVDVDQEAGFVRGTTWANVYSPRAVRLDLELAAQPGVDAAGMPAVLLSWNGLPGTGLGGMNTTTAVDVLQDEYAIAWDAAGDHGPRTTLRGLPIQASAARSLVARWWTTATRLAPSRLSVTGTGLLEGNVVNPLDVELSQCFVFFENWAFPIGGRMAPGEVIEIDAITPLDLRWHLMRRRVVEAVDMTTPWDRADLSDPPRIAEMLMFFSAAGGRAYTRLSHSFQAHVDLSRHLRVGRAILVGRSKAAASRLDQPGPAPGDRIDQQWTFYRVSIPVTGVAP